MMKKFKSIQLALLVALFLALPTVAAADYASVVAADSPTTWWRLEGNLDDSSGNSRPATYLSYVPHTTPLELIPGTTPVFTTSAAGLGSAIVFDEGDGSWENVEATLPVNGSFSAELWAKSKFNDKYYGDGTFISAYGPLNDFLLYPRHATKTVTAYNDWGTIWQDVPDVTIAGDVDVWRHFVVTYDNNTAGEQTYRLYVDGALASEAYHGMVRSNTPLDLLVAVGRYIPITGKFDSGFFTSTSFDEFAIYDYELSASQIDAHYQEAGVALPPVGTYAEEVAADDPNTWWRFEEATCNDYDPVIDHSGNNHTGEYVLDVLHVPGVTSQLGQGAKVGPTTNGGAVMGVTPINDSFTAEIWLKSSQATWYGFGGGAQSVSINGYVIAPIAPAKWLGYIGKSDAEDSKQGLDPLYDIAGNDGDITEWHHYAVSFDKPSGIARMFFDGQLVNTVDLGTGFPRTSNANAVTNLGIYRWPDNGSYFVTQNDVAFDEFALYETALAPARINAHFRAAAIPDANDIGLFDENGDIANDCTALSMRLVAEELNLNDGDPVTTMVDLSGNGNDANAPATHVNSYITNTAPVYRANACGAYDAIEFDTSVTGEPGSEVVNYNSLDIDGIADVLNGHEYVAYFVMRTNADYTQEAHGNPSFLSAWNRSATGGLYAGLRHNWHYNDGEDNVAEDSFPRLEVHGNDITNQSWSYPVGVNPWVNTNWHVWMVVDNGTSIQIHVDGVLKGEASQVTPQDDIDSVVLGAIDPMSSVPDDKWTVAAWSGAIAEVLVYDDSLSNEMRTELYDYLYDKYVVARLYDADMSGFNNFVDFALIAEEWGYDKCDPVQPITRDSSGNMHTGLVFGSLVSEAGKSGLGNAITLDSWDGMDYVFATLPVAGSYTVEMWGKSDHYEYPGCFNGVGSFVSGYAEKNDFLLYPVHAEPNVHAYTDEGDHWLGTPPYSVGDTDVWRHYVMTFENTVEDVTRGELKLYVDGLEVSDANTGYVRLDVANVDVYVGAYKALNGNFDYSLTGSIDEVAIYATALPPTRVLAHYDAANDSQIDYETTVLADIPTTYWRFEPEENLVDCLADFDGDGDVDINDFANFAQYWLR